MMPNFVNTELSTGMTEVRAFKNSDPEDVAGAIVAALQFPRFDVYVPKSAGPTWVGVNLLPRRARDMLGRALKIDRAFAQADHRARAAYEARAAASAPAAEAVIAETEKHDSESESAAA